MEKNKNIWDWSKHLWKIFFVFLISLQLTLVHVTPVFSYDKKNYEWQANEKELNNTDIENAALLMSVYMLLGATMFVGAYVVAKCSYKNISSRTFIAGTVLYGIEEIVLFFHMIERSFELKKVQPNVHNQVQVFYHQRSLMDQSIEYSKARLGVLGQLMFTWSGAIGAAGFEQYVFRKFIGGLATLNGAVERSISGLSTSVLSEMSRPEYSDIASSISTELSAPLSELKSTLVKYLPQATALSENNGGDEAKQDSPGASPPLTPRTRMVRQFSQEISKEFGVTLTKETVDTFYAVAGKIYAAAKILEERAKGYIVQLASRPAPQLRRMFTDIVVNSEIAEKPIAEFKAKYSYLNPCPEGSRKTIENSMQGNENIHMAPPVMIFLLKFFTSAFALGAEDGENQKAHEVGLMAILVAMVGLPLVINLISGMLGNISPFVWSFGTPIRRLVLFSTFLATATTTLGLMVKTLQKYQERKLAVEYQIVSFCEAKGDAQLGFSTSFVFNDEEDELCSGSEYGKIIDNVCQGLNLFCPERRRGG
jgi:hypothetical protein